MKIHFSASIDNISNRVDIYRLIKMIIEEHNDTLTRDWIEDAYSYSVKGIGYSKLEAKDIATETRKSIEDCDIAIFESSEQSFGVGYQAALAMNLQKPILVLQEKGSRSIGVIGTGQNTNIKKIEYYNDRVDLKKIIIGFIEENVLSLKDLRFNMLLNREQLYFINNESTRTGLSKSQVIRNLINDEAKKIHNI